MKIILDKSRAMPVVCCGHQFKNWWLPYNLPLANWQSNPSSSAKKKTTPLGVVFLFIIWIGIRIHFNATVQRLVATLIYAMASCYEELGDYANAYTVYNRIAEDLERRGFEVEVNWPRSLAHRCRERMGDGF